MADEEGMLQRAMVLCDQGNLLEAEQIYSNILAEQPANFSVRHLLGLVRFQQGRLDEARADMATALSAYPDFAEAHANLAIVLDRLDLLEEALAHHDRAAELKTDSAEIYNNRGVALKRLGRMDQAAVDFDRALLLRPDYLEARLNRSTFNLLRGNLLQGWLDQEWRWQLKNGPKREFELPFPKWVGQNLRGKRIIVYQEQGLGDTIQFSRFLSLLEEAGASVTFWVDPKLARLFRAFEPPLQVIDRFNMIERFDFQSALMSLPAGFRTTLDIIPSRVPYLSAEPDLVAKWQHRIGPAELKVGICWHSNDSRRSIPLHCFEPLLAIPNLRLISLQKVHGLEQIEQLPPSCNIELLGEDWETGPSALVDTAAVMSSLDLINSCDTSIAHLAGALARPVWVAIPMVPDWRWLLDRSDSPWYPTMKLYRQTTRGDWNSCFRRIGTDLERLSNRP
jgi:tetratricopeptide (TPR) repeat protein